MATNGTVENGVFMYFAVKVAEVNKEYSSGKTAGGNTMLSDNKIETERLILRPPTNADLDDWASRVFADPEVIRYMPKRDMTPYARAERALMVSNENWTAHGYGGWIIRDKVDGQLVGSCDLDREELGEVELGYCLAKAYWGKGIATETAQAIVRFAFETLKLERLVAVVVPENIASWRLLENIGFKYEKKAHYYGWDVEYYGIRRDQFQYPDSFYYLQSQQPLGGENVR